MYNYKIKEDLDCGIRAASKVFGGKWKCCILDAISKGIDRPADIKRYIEEASIRVVELQLSELLFFGVVERFSEDVYPKKSHYKLTSLGISILPILSMMDQWGIKNSEFIKERQKELNNSE